jgi:hypothetical protein
MLANTQIGKGISVSLSAMAPYPAVFLLLIAGASAVLAAQKRLVQSVQPKGTQITMPSVSTSSAEVCPKCSSAMLMRTAKRGANAGNSFWGLLHLPSMQAAQLGCGRTAGGRVSAIPAPPTTEELGVGLQPARPSVPRPDLLHMAPA